MATPTKRQQKPLLNRKRRATEDAKSGAKDKRRRVTNPAASMPTNSQEVAKKTLRRKRDDSPDHEPRKKAMTKDHRIVEKTERTYREPKGARKSRRIAGKPADRSGLPLDGRYVQPVVPNGPHELDDAVSRPDISGAQDQQPDVLDPQRVVEQSEALNGTQSLPETPGAQTPEPNVQKTQHVVQQKEVEYSVDGDVGQSSNRPREFLQLVANNVRVHRAVCFLTDNYNKWTHRSVDLVHAKHGLNHLEDQIRFMERAEESSQAGLERLRINRSQRLRQLDGARIQVHSLTQILNNLNAKHASRNERMYGFKNIRKDSDELACLPQEFWKAYNRCVSAHSTCEDLAQEARRLENEQLEVFQLLDKQTGDSVRRGEGRSEVSPSETAPQSALEGLAEQTRALSKTSESLSELERELNAAKDKQFDQESKLNQIAEKALVAAGLMAPLTGDEEVELQRRLPDIQEPGTQQATQQPNAGVVSTTAALRQAKEKLENCRCRLDEIRSGPFSDASSLDSEARGEARVRKMIERTRAIRDAENHYKSVLHRAQDDGAVSDKDQVSNFRDHESDGYAESDYSRYMKHPTGRAMARRVSKWAQGVGESTKSHQIAKNPAAEDKEGGWVSRVSSMDIGDDWMLRPSTRIKRLIEQQKELCKHLRATGPFENAENDFHPKNNPVRSSGGEVDQSDRGTHTQRGAHKEVIPQSREQSRVPPNEFLSFDGYESASKMRERKKVRTARSL